MPENSIKNSSAINLSNRISYAQFLQKCKYKSVGCNVKYHIVASSAEWIIEDHCTVLHCNALVEYTERSMKNTLAVTLILKLKLNLTTDECCAVRQEKLRVIRSRQSAELDPPGGWTVNNEGIVARECSC